MQKVRNNAKNCFSKKKFESHAMKNERKNNLKDSQNLVKVIKVKVSVEHEEECFSLKIKVLLMMIKDKSTFANLY